MFEYVCQPNGSNVFKSASVRAGASDFTPFSITIVGLVTLCVEIIS